jgi:hypothetical protein
MLAKPKDLQQRSFLSTFEEQLSHQHPLYILSNRVDWKRFEDASQKHYSKKMGFFPKKPAIRFDNSIDLLNPNYPKKFNRARIL